SLNYNGAYTVVASDAFFISQSIEAVNFSESNWGTVNAIPATLSFWAYAGTAGTYGGSVRNGPASGNSGRSYPFSFTLPASTFVYVTIHVLGDTAGIWTLTGNAGAVNISFSVGAGSTYSAAAGAWIAGNYISVPGAVSVVGTSGAALTITGVQFEFNPVATPFERRSIGEELAACQRYYEKSYLQGSAAGTATTQAMTNVYFTGVSSAANSINIPIVYKATKRVVPTLTIYSPATSTAGKAHDYSGNAADVTATIQFPGDGSFVCNAPMAAATPTINIGFHWTADAEL
ncbi:MAG TPA: hypothetical protein VGG68_00100, partial [Caulobacteraceae bacterium]